MQKSILFSRGNLDAAGLSLPQSYQCRLTRQGIQVFFSQVFQARTCFQKDVTLPWFMRRAMLHLSMSAILTSYMALVANKARITYALANETSRHQQTCEGTSAPSTTTWTIMTLVCPPRDVCLTSLTSTLCCQHIAPTSITGQHSPDGKSSHLNIAHHVDRQVSPCSRLSADHRLGHRWKAHGTCMEDHLVHRGHRHAHPSLVSCEDANPQLCHALTCDPFSLSWGGALPRVCHIRYRL